MDLSLVGLEESRYGLLLTLLSSSSRCMAQVVAQIVRTKLEAIYCCR